MLLILVPAGKLESVMFKLNIHFDSWKWEQVSSRNFFYFSFLFPSLNRFAYCVLLAGGGTYVISIVFYFGTGAANCPILTWEY